MTQGAVVVWLRKCARQDGAELASLAQPRVVGALNVALLLERTRLAKVLSIDAGHDRIAAQPMSYVESSATPETAHLCQNRFWQTSSTTSLVYSQHALPLHTHTPISTLATQYTHAAQSCRATSFRERARRPMRRARADLRHGESLQPNLLLGSYIKNVWSPESRNGHHTLCKTGSVWHYIYSHPYHLSSYCLLPLCLRLTVYAMCVWGGLGARVGGRPEEK